MSKGASSLDPCALAETNGTWQNQVSNFVSPLGVGSDGEKRIQPEARVDLVNLSIACMVQL